MFEIERNSEKSQRRTPWWEEPPAPHVEPSSPEIPEPVVQANQELEPIAVDPEVEQDDDDDFKYETPAFLKQLSGQERKSEKVMITLRVPVKMLEDIKKKRKKWNITESRSLIFLKLMEKWLRRNQNRDL